MMRGIFPRFFAVSLVKVQLCLLELVLVGPMCFAPTALFLAEVPTVSGTVLPSSAADGVSRFR